MTVCKFFQQGNCRYGDSCRFEHPGAQTNRFAPLANQGGNGAFGSRANATVQDNPYHLVAQDIKDDLTNRRDHEKGERPIYRFGAYGPGKGAPKQLIDGRFEQSPEELRVSAYLALASGALPQFEAQYNDLERSMNDQINSFIQNPDEAIRRVANESHTPQQPNRNASVIIPATGTWPYRLEQTQVSTSGGSGTTSFAASSFGAASRPGFGGASQPAFGSPSIPSGGSAFGGASSGAAGGFGAPSALGPKPSPFGAAASAAPSTGFGAPSALGSKPSPFGGAQPAAASAAPSTGFGAPSALGSKPSPFGGAQPAASGFGAPSAIGAKPSPFAAPQQATTGAFGAPSTIGAKPSPFGQPQQSTPGGFGAPSQPAFGANPFASAPSQQSNASPFAASAQSTAPSQQSNASPFTASAQSTGGFGSQQPAAQTNSSPFGGSQQPQAQTAGSAFGAPSSIAGARFSPFSVAAQQQQTQPVFDRPNPFSANAAQKNAIPSTWKNKGRVVLIEEEPKMYGYVVEDKNKADGKGVERIWFPEGGPAGVPEADPKLKAAMEAPAAVYEDPLIGPKLKEIYEWTAEHGTFVKDGKIMMPEIPPRREWCKFDF